jgi:hypothetical protein
MEKNNFKRDILENLLAKTDINIKFKIGLNPLQISKIFVSKKPMTLFITLKQVHDL